MKENVSKNVTEIEILNVNLPDENTIIERNIPEFIKQIILLKIMKSININVSLSINSLKMNLRWLVKITIYWCVLNAIVV